MNINNGSMPHQSPVRGTEATQGASTIPGNSAIRAVPVGHGYSAAAGHIAPGQTQNSTRPLILDRLPDGRLHSFQQREVTAARPWVSAQQSKHDLGSRMAELVQLTDRLSDIYQKAKDIPMIANLAKQELENIQGGTPANIIRGLKDYIEALKFSGDDPVFDSSQAMTAESATRTLKAFESKIDQLLSKPNVETTLKNLAMAIAFLKPSIRTNNTVYQESKSVIDAQSQAALAKELQLIINKGDDPLTHVLSMTQGNDGYQSLKTDLELCIQDICIYKGVS